MLGCALCVSTQELLAPIPRKLAFSKFSWMSLVAVELGGEAILLPFIMQNSVASSKVSRGSFTNQYSLPSIKMDVSWCTPGKHNAIGNFNVKKDNTFKHEYKTFCLVINIYSHHTFSWDFANLKIAEILKT